MKAEVLLLDGLRTTTVSGCFSSWQCFLSVWPLMINLLFIVIQWYLYCSINDQNIQVDYLSVMQTFSLTSPALSVRVLYSPFQLNLCQWYARCGLVLIYFSTIFSLFTFHLTITCLTLIFKVFILCWKMWNFSRLN